MCGIVVVHDPTGPGAASGAPRLGLVPDEGVSAGLLGQLGTA